MAGIFADLMIQTTCKLFRPFKYSLVAGYTTGESTYYPYVIHWSNNSVHGSLPTSWVTSAGNMDGGA